jgi:hypothetical protein
VTNTQLLTYPSHIHRVCILSPARPFASSLESLSACDMRTIHAIADPHLRVEMATHGQYCGPMKSARVKRRPSKRSPNKRGPNKRRRGGDDRDYFDEYCNSIFSDWRGCKQLATTLINAGDEELAANIKAYRDGSCEECLYDPFGYLANRAFRVARQDLLASKLSSSHNGTVSSAEVGLEDTLLNLVAVPAHNRPVLGCAGDRK